MKKLFYVRMDGLVDVLNIFIDLRFHHFTFQQSLLCVKTILVMLSLCFALYTTSRIQRNVAILTVHLVRTNMTQLLAWSRSSNESQMKESEKTFKMIDLEGWIELKAYTTR